MCWRVNKVNKSVTLELAEAISTYNLAGVSSLLSDAGKYAVLSVDDEVCMSDKAQFLSWLGRSYSGLRSSALWKRKMTFTIVRSMHSINGSSIILFNEGRFPEFSGKQAMEEKSGLIVEAAKDKITAIEFCYLVAKTENPFIYERRCLKARSI
jgi:hypothetical protein